MSELGELRQSPIALGLSEYTSRLCRLKLVEAAVGGIERELAEKCARGLSGIDKRTGGARVLAGILGVSVRSVQRWLSGGVQSCNVNAEKLIKVAVEYAPGRTADLLEEDMERHRFEFEGLMGEVRQGVIALSREAI